jgi:hypothetical protein
MKDRWQKAYGIAKPATGVEEEIDADSPAQDSPEGKLLQTRQALINKHPNADILRKYARQSSKWHKRRKKVALSAASLRQIRQEPHELQKILQQRIDGGGGLRMST